MGKLRERQGKPHPYLPELCEALRSERIDRRSFVRTACLLGLSAASAYALAGRLTGRPFATPAQAAETPKAGGSLRVAMWVQEMADPATYAWVEKSNQARGLVEYLVRTGPDNVTRPYLAERWEASDDLKAWTFHLRQGIKWSNGDDFGADDVVANFQRWLDPTKGSSNIGLFAAMTSEVDTGKTDDKGQPVKERRMSEGAVEKIDAHTVRLHLNQAVPSIPENFYNYPTAIVHRRFDEEGGDLSRNPVGTGPFTLAEFRVGELCVLKRRDDYWGEKAWLDEVRYLDFGQDPAAGLSALASGQIDLTYQSELEHVAAIRTLPGVTLFEVVTAQTGVARMRVDTAPFDNKPLRQAIAACCDRERMLEIAYKGLGAAGEDHMVAPIHPEYFPLPKQKQDYERARQLLAEAGYADGIRLKIDVGNATGVWEQRAMEELKQQLAPAGIDMEINMMPSASFWDIWDKTAFGFTPWTHRPLGVMVLNLAFRAGVPWNESKYDNPAFEKALDVASGLLDVEERRKAMEEVERILQDDAVFVQPLWRSVFSAGVDRLRGYTMHPTQYHEMSKVWLA